MLELCLLLVLLCFCVVFSVFFSFVSLVVNTSATNFWKYLSPKVTYYVLN